MTDSARISRRLLLLGGAVLLGSALVAGWVLHSRADTPPPSAPTETQEAPAERVAVGFGYVDVEPGVASLYPLQPGRVDAVRVAENQEVRAGTILLSLDARMAESLVRQAEADLESVETQRRQADKLIDQQRIKEAEQQAVIEAVGDRLKAAQVMAERKAELVRLQHLNAKEQEAAQAQLEEVQATLRGEQRKLEELRLNDPRDSIRRAEADVLAKQARLDLAKLNRSECDLKAPTDGTVLRILVSPGDVLGSQPRQPAILFCPRSPRIIRAEIEQEFAAPVRVGASALIQDDTSSAEAWHGKVLRVSGWYTHRRSLIQEPLQLNDVRTLECLIALEGEHPNLRIGQRVRVSIHDGGAQTAHRETKTGS